MHSDPNLPSANERRTSLELQLSAQRQNFPIVSGSISCPFQGVVNHRMDESNLVMFERGEQGKQHTGPRDWTFSPRLNE
jgi:hypothetical protein